MQRSEGKSIESLYAESRSRISAEEVRETRLCVKYLSFRPPAMPIPFSGQTYLIQIGARNNDEDKVWSVDDMRSLDGVFKNCKVAGWTCVRGLGKWLGGSEQSRSLIVAASERQVENVVQQMIATFEQDSILVIELGRHAFVDGRPILKKMASRLAKPRKTAPNKVDK